MNRREKLYSDESNKSRRKPKNEPSFSSILLDEIFRSMDMSGEKTEDLKFYGEKTVKRQLVFYCPADQSSCAREHEEVGSFRRACLDKNFIKADQNEKVLAGKKPPLTPKIVNKSLQDRDLLLFGSTSSSSDSSGALSASDTDFFASTKIYRVPCFSSAAKPPKPVKTCSKIKQEEGLKHNDQKNTTEAENLVKSKSRALKFYANFKNMKQPISPGGKFTSFINSLFNNANEKESKNLGKNRLSQFQDSKKSSKPSYSTCASASPFSRSSSLSQNSPKSTEKSRNGIRRRVRFDSVSVIADKDLRLGEKIIGNSPGAKNEADNAIKGHQNQRKEDYWGGREAREGGKCDSDDAIMSDSSSDLFELDHLLMYKTRRFCDVKCTK